MDTNTKIAVELIMATSTGIERIAVVQLFTVPRKDESILCREVGKDSDTLFRVMEVVHTERGLMLFGTVTQFAVANIR